MLKKNDLVDRYAQDMEVSKKDATLAVEKVIDLIKTAVVEDGGVDIYGFVKLEKIHKDACEKRNPRTGEMGHVDAKFVPKAKFSSDFKREVNT